MGRDPMDLIPEYETGSETSESSAIKPASTGTIELSSFDAGTAPGTKAPYDTGKPHRIVTRGKILHEPQD